MPSLHCVERSAIGRDEVGMVVVVVAGVACWSWWYRPRATPIVDPTARAATRMAATTMTCFTGSA
jgi:hypothetical protein